MTQGANITVLTDADVDNDLIFTKNRPANAYDIIILGHQEYVTQKEYDNLRKFVTNGGTMIILDGNVFFAEVKYDRSNQTVTLVKGHWWAFNGKSAWKSVNERWAKETSTWVGSNYLCYRCVNKFTNDPFGYTPHEEQYVTNPHDIILLNYDASLSRSIMSRSKPVIASYELSYQKGRTIALGIYSEDIISNGRFDRYLDSLLLQYDIKISD
ncbi:MAG TPA: N,N-dimethylformamidase beta subunit family domain-containing protein [Nitrososphaeraceae archaeon]